MKTLRSLALFAVLTSGSSFAHSRHEGAKPLRVAAVRMSDATPAQDAAAEIESPPQHESASSLQSLKRGLKSKRGADALVHRAMVALEKNRTSLARHLVKRALLRNPDHAMAHLVAGLVAQLDGNQAQAKKEYSYYLFFDPIGRYAGELRWIVCNSQQQQLASR